MEKGDDGQFLPSVGVVLPDDGYGEHHISEKNRDAKPFEGVVVEKLLPVSVFVAELILRVVTTGPIRGIW